MKYKALQIKSVDHSACKQKAASELDAELKRQKAELEKQFQADLQNEKKAHVEAAKNLEMQIEDLSTQLFQQKSQVTGLQATLTTSQKLKIELNQAKLDFEHEKQEHEKTTRTLTTTRSQLDLKIQEHEKTTRQLNTSYSHAEKIQEELRQLNSQHSTLLDEMSRLKLERDRLASEKTNLESENARIQTEFTTTSNQLDQAKNSLNLTKTNLAATQAELDKAAAEALQQRGRADVISEENHVPGIFSQRDPAVPGDFFGLYQQLMGQIKTYSGLVMRKFTAATKSAQLKDTPSPEPVFVQRFMQHIVPGHQFINEAMPLPDNYFRKAMLVGSFVRELLVGFGSEALEMGSVSLPIDVTKLRPLRAGYRGQHDLIMKTRTTDLKGSDSSFFVWFTGVLNRLKAIWLGVGDDETVWVQFFEDPATEMAAQLWEIGRYTWALNKLSLAYPIPPHMLRLDNGTAVKKELCKSWFNEDAEVEQNFREGLMVFCVVFPGFQVDTNIQECDVVWVATK